LKDVTSPRFFLLLIAVALYGDRSTNYMRLFSYKTATGRKRGGTETFHIIAYIEH